MGFNRKSFVAALVVGLGLAVSSPGFAADKYDQLDRGPKVGTTIPHMLNSVDHRNQHQDFKSLARRRGLIILFSRSLDW